MKKYSLFLKVGVFMLAAGLFQACNKDDSKSVTVKDYITVEEGTVVNGSMPAESGTGISAVITANARALEGGSSPISINPSGTANHVLIGIEGVSGYYSVAFTDLQSTSNGYMAVILFDNDLPTDEFTIIAEVLNNANDAVGGRTEIVVSTLAQSAAGKLQVSLSWDLLNDIDLHLVEPDGNEIYYGNEGYISYDWERIYAEHPDDYYELTEDELAQYIIDDETTTGTLDLDSNPGCSIDSVNNENIIYVFNTDVQTGEYIVRVDFFSDCVGSGTSNYIVTARYNNELITPTSGNNPSYGLFESGTADYGGEGDGIEVMRFNISELKSIDNTQRIYLEKPGKRSTGNMSMSKIHEHLINRK